MVQVFERQDSFSVGDDSIILNAFDMVTLELSFARA